MEPLTVIPGQSKRRVVRPTLPTLSPLSTGCYFFDSEIGNYHYAQQHPMKPRTSFRFAGIKANTSSRPHKGKIAGTRAIASEAARR
jgi:hypothetical protein